MDKLREEVELIVIATNYPLQKAVREMDYVTLLRNMHPSFRQDYARKLLKAEKINNQQMLEFI